MAAKSLSKGEAREYLLAKLKDVIENESDKTTDRIKAIQLFGQEYGLFVEQKNIKFDVNTVVRHFTDSQLAGIASGKELTDGTIIEAEYLPSPESGLEHSRCGDDLDQLRPLMGTGAEGEGGSPSDGQQGADAGDENIDVRDPTC